MVLVNILQEARKTEGVKNNFADQYEYLTKEIRKYSQTNKVEWDGYTIDDLLQTKEYDHPLLDQKYRKDLIKYMKSFLDTKSSSEVKNMIYELLQNKYEYEAIKSSSNSSNTLKKVLYIILVVIILLIAAGIIGFTGQVAIKSKGLPMNFSAVIIAIVGGLILYATYIIKVPIKKINDTNINKNLRKFNILDSSLLDFDSLAEIFASIDEDKELTVEDKNKIAETLYQYITSYIKLRIDTSSGVDLVREIQGTLDNQYDKFLASNNVMTKREPSFVKNIFNSVKVFNKDYTKAAEKRKEAVANEYIIRLKEILIENEITAHEWEGLNEELLRKAIENPDFEDITSNVLLKIFSKIKEEYSNGLISVDTGLEEFVTFSKFSTLVNKRTFREDFVKKFGFINENLEEIVSVDQVSKYFKNREIGQGLKLGLYILLMIVGGLFASSFIKNSIGLNFKGLKPEEILNKIMVIGSMIIAFVIVVVIVVSKWNITKNVLGFNNDIYRDNIDVMKRESFNLQRIVEELDNKNNINEDDKKKLYKSLMPVLKSYSNLNYLRDLGTDGSQRGDSVPVPVSDLLINIGILAVIIMLAVFAFVRLDPLRKTTNIKTLNDCMKILVDPSSSGLAKQKCNNQLETMISNTFTVKILATLVTILTVSMAVSKISQNSSKFGGNLQQSKLFTDKKAYIL